MRGSMQDFGRPSSVQLHRAERWHSYAIAAAALALLFACRASSEESGALRVAQAVEEQLAAEDTNEKPAAMPTDESSDQSETVEATEGVEVMHVKGRTAAAIETEVPASITQFDASMIQALGAQDVSDLARVTPNVNIVQPGATQATFYVRGIGLQSFDANATGAVTIFQDEVALDLPAIQTGQLYDIQDVQIMRGPQGTGPFRNASAGAIRVQSNLPTGNYGAQLRSSIGRYAADGGKGAHHALIQDYEGYVEMPVVPEALSSRFAFRLRKSDPYQTNGCGDAPPISARIDPTPTNQRDAVAPGGPRPRGDDPTILNASDICGERGSIWQVGRISGIPPGMPSRVDFEDTWAARGFLRFQPPNTELDFVLNGHGSRLDEDQTYGQAIGTSNIRTGSFNRGRFFGGSAGNSGTSNYWEPDQQEEFLALCRTAPCNGPAGDPTIAAFERTLAQGRPLDRRPYRGDYDREGKTTRDTWGGYASGKAQVSDLEIFALGSFDGYKRFRDTDTDFTPDVLFEQVEEDKAWQSYEELHVGGELEAAPLEWQLGGYYLHEELDSDSATSLASEARIDRVFAQDTDSLGAWGKFSWDFLDDVTLDGGVRWNWERKKFKLHRQLFLGGGVRPLQDSRTDDATTWQTPTGNLTLTYHFNEAVSAFAKYSRGFKAGHYNALASEDIERPPADPEYNDAWEAGLAGAWFDRRLSGSVSYFYYRYQDYQIFLFRDVANEPPVLEIVNAAQAENYGIEIEGRIQPLRGWTPQLIEGLELSANAGWLHGEFLDFQIRNKQVSGPETVPITIDFSGDQLLNSPEFKASGAVDWAFNFGRYGYLIPRYDFSWTDDVAFGLNDGRGTSTSDLQGTPRLPAFAIGQKAYWIHNLRLAYRTPTGNLEVAVFCRNLEDTVYKNYAFDATNFSQVVLNFVGKPRTIGFDVMVTF
jgi:outer membrane receptor protein involved in Fe transport